MTDPDCVFCKIVSCEAPADVLFRNHKTMVIKPLNPYVPGHALVIPTKHVPDAMYSPSVTGEMMRAALNAAYNLFGEGAPFNVLTSIGAEATQTVFHLHLHLIPRGPDDGLGKDWPWMREGHGA